MVRTIPRAGQEAPWSTPPGPGKCSSEAKEKYLKQIETARLEEEVYYLPVQGSDVAGEWCENLQVDAAPYPFRDPLQVSIPPHLHDETA